MAVRSAGGLTNPAFLSFSANYQELFAYATAPNAEGCFITEWWNSTADPAVSVARARVKPGVTTRWHRLCGVTERYLILEGQGRVEIGDGSPEDIGPGAGVLIPPGVRQRITNMGDADLIFLAICTPRFTLAGYEDLDPA